MITARHFLARLGQVPLLRHVGLYITFNGLAAIFPLIALPVLTRQVSPNNYGVYGIFLVGVVLLMPLISAGIETAVARRFVDRAETDFRAYVSTAVILTLGLSIVALIILNVFQSQLTKMIPIPVSWYSIWIIVAWGQVVSGLVLGLLQMEQRPVAYGFWRVGRALLLNAALLAFVMLGHKTWQGLVAAQFVAHSIFALYGLVWLVRSGYLGIKWHEKELRPLLRYSLPLVPHMMSAAIIAGTDRLLLTNLMNEAAAGIYTVGYQVAQIMFLISMSINRAWTPWFYSKMKEGSALSKRRAVITGYGMAAILLCVGSGLGAVGWIVLPLLVGPSYATATLVFIWIVAAFTAHGLFSLASSYIFFVGRTEWISLATGIVTISNIGLTYWLIGLNGLVGAAQATFLAYVLAFIFCLILTIRLSELPWLSARN